MTAYVLVIGILMGGEVRLIVPPVPMDDLASCEEAARHPAVIGSYSDVYPEHEVRVWCEPKGGEM